MKDIKEIARQLDNKGLPHADIRKQLEVMHLIPPNVLELDARLTGKRGKWSSLVYSSEQRNTIKGAPKISKVSTYTGLQGGISYNNKAIVKEQHENGQVEKKGLPANTIALSKVLRYNYNTGNFSFGFGLTKKTESTSVYFIDGKEVDYSIVKHFLKPKKEGAKKYERTWQSFNPSHIVNLH